MGDFGGPLVSTMEALPTRTKSGALHVENSLLPLDNFHNSSMNRVQTFSSPNMALENENTLKPVDTPLQNSTSSTPAEPATPTSDQPLDQPKAKDFAVNSTKASRPATSSSSSSHFKPPTPVRTYREHPRIWITDGPEAGKCVAEWRKNYVPIFEDSTKTMTIEERAKFFDALVKEDEERYCQALATYYTVHPEHIPEREPHPKTLKKIEEGMKSSPKYDMAQQKCFGDWNSWGARTTEVVPEVGPKDEETPDEEVPECEHCVKEAKKSKSLIRKVFRTFSSSKDQYRAKTARRATESSKEKRPEVVISIQERSAEEEHASASEHSGSSSDGKEREALTETGIGMTKAIPKKRMRLSTVHTR